MYQGIIFDFNGVLLWDNQLHDQVWKEFSRNLRGTALTDEEVAQYVHGRTNPVILQYLMNGTLTASEIDRFSHEKEEAYRELCLSDMDNYRLSPGAIELLDFLVAEEIPHTIATASEKENVDFYLEYLDLARWFEVDKIVYGDGIIPGKPAPDMYLKAAENIAVPPEVCIVVEDSVSGMQAARAAGIGHIVALGPLNNHSRLAQVEGVHRVVETLVQLPKSQLFYSPNGKSG